MKKLLSLSFLLIGTIGSSLLIGCKSVKNVAQTNDKSIVVLYENDVHCGIEGYAGIAGMRDAISDTAYVALVSNGDYLQGGTAGAISHGQYIVDIMKHVHYDAVTLGNHEFDYGVPAMIDLLKQIEAPVVCVNLFDMQNKPVYQPYIIKQMGSKKVAFVGVVTPTALYTEEYAFFDAEGKQQHHLSEKDVYRLVQENVNKARKEGADYVIVLSHLGEDENPLNVDSHGLIASTTGIDAVLDGHTHSVVPSATVMNKEGKPVLVSQTGTKLQNLGKLVITPQGVKTTEMISRNKFSVMNIEVKQATQKVEKQMKELVSREICVSDVDLRILDEKGNQAVRVGETNAGDIVADAYRIITGADFAITNGGGIRTEVKAGNLTYGDIVSLLPYDNYVSLVEITGQQLLDLLKACTQFLPVENGDFPQVSGMKFTVNVGQGESISNLVILNKNTNEYEPVDLNKTYVLATIDYCITGGGLQGKLKKNKVLKPNIMIYNQCLIQYVTEKLNSHIGKEYAEPQGRITVKY